MNDWQSESAARKATIAATLENLGLTVESEFVPFSQSRNKGEKIPSLNWKVTVKRNGRDVLTVDYTAGCAHCPAKATKAPSIYPGKDRYRADMSPYPGTTSSYRRPTEAERLSDYLAEWRAVECETGVAMEHSPFAGEATFKPKRERKPGDDRSHTLPIKPDPVDVVHSLVMDSDVLNSGGFEDWASDLGYDPDSRHAESIYRACLEIALKMRGAIGESGMETSRDAYRDY